MHDLRACCLCGLCGDRLYLSETFCLAGGKAGRLYFFETPSLAGGKAKVRFLLWILNGCHWRSPLRRIAKAQATAPRNSSVALTIIVYAVQMCSAWSARAVAATGRAQNGPPVHVQHARIYFRSAALPFSATIQPLSLLNISVPLPFSQSGLHPPSALYLSPRSACVIIAVAPLLTELDPFLSVRPNRRAT